jgi:hypothetical protein
MTAILGMLVTERLVRLAPVDLAIVVFYFLLVFCICFYLLLFSIIVYVFFFFVLYMTA